MNLNIVPASQGLAWLKESFRIIRSRWGLFLMISLIMIITMFGVMIILGFLMPTSNLNAAALTQDPQKIFEAFAVIIRGMLIPFIFIYFIIFALFVYYQAAIMVAAQQILVFEYNSNNTESNEQQNWDLIDAQPTIGSIFSTLIKTPSLFTLSLITATVTLLFQVIILVVTFYGIFLITGINFMLAIKGDYVGFAESMTQLSNASFIEAQSSATLFQFVHMALSLLFYATIFILFSMTPAIVIFGKVTAVKAIFINFMTVVKNWRAWLIWGLIIMAISIVFFVVVPLLVGLLTALKLALIAGGFVVIALLVFIFFMVNMGPISYYLAFQDCLSDKEDQYDDSLHSGDQDYSNETYKEF